MTYSNMKKVIPGAHALMVIQISLTHSPVQLFMAQGLNSARLGHGIPLFVGFLIIARPLTC